MKPDQLLADTNLCVKCGLCLPHCPTYSKTLDENESPRGRIALVQAWSNGNLPDSPGMRAHIDQCLLCRACENVCPAQVPYARILDGFRSSAGQAKKTVSIRIVSALSRNLLVNKKLSSFVTRLVKTDRPASRLPQWVNRIPMVQRLQSFSRDLQSFRARDSLYRTQKAKRGCVGLFTGCTGDLFDAATIDAAIRVLGHLGFDVRIDADQRCCGALDLHAGNLRSAENFARHNHRAFDRDDVDWIVSVASGCGALLSEYPDYFPKTQSISGRVIDISKLVVNSNGLNSLNLAPLNAKVLLHHPCSLRNVLKSESATETLVRQIGEAEIVHFPEPKCCGAAGNYMLEHPKMADTLRQDLLQTVVREQPDYLLTSNIGCALHLRAGLRPQNIATEVLHPITLIDRQLRI